jgi:hypothetical protein
MSSPILAIMLYRLRYYDFYGASKKLQEEVAAPP